MATEVKEVSVIGQKGKLLGSFLLTISYPTLTFKEMVSRRIVATFSIPFVRKYGQRNTKFAFEAGSRCIGLEGFYEFVVCGERLDVSALITKQMKESKAQDAKGHVGANLSSSPPTLSAPPTKATPALDSAGMPSIFAKPSQVLSARQDSREEVILARSAHTYANVPESAHKAPAPHDQYEEVIMAAMPVKPHLYAEPSLPSSKPLKYADVNFSSSAHVPPAPQKPERPLAYTSLDISQTKQLAAQPRPATARTRATRLADGRPIPDQQDSDSSDSDLEDFQFMEVTHRQPEDQPALKSKIRARLLFSNKAENFVELTAKAGDVVFVLEQQYFYTLNKRRGSADWWACSLGDREGILPSSWLQIIT